MFDIRLFAFLILASLPGLLITIPGQIIRLRDLIERRARPGSKIPPNSTLIAASLLQNLVLVGIASAAGTGLSSEAGLGAPFFTALVSGDPLGLVLAPDLLPILTVSVLAMVPFLFVYYGLVRPRLTPETIRIAEGIRMDLGLGARLLYGGVVEEVLFRWGVMTSAAWLGMVLLDSGRPLAMWTAILVAGVLFGLGHLPGLSAMGVKMTGFLVVSTVGLNLWAAVIFGWLFWQYGLYAAMIGHMIFHLVWYPLDRRAYHGLVRSQSTSLE